MENKELLQEMGTSYKKKKKESVVKEPPPTEVKEKKKERKVFVMPAKDRERTSLNKTTGMI